MKKRIFNVAGPCIPGEHYMLGARERCGELLDLIESKQFFVIHAARQTGKTTLLNNLEQELNAGDEYHALYCSLESVQPFADPEKGIPAVVDAIRSACSYQPVLKELRFAPDFDGTAIGSVVKDAFAAMASALDRPLVCAV